MIVRVEISDPVMLGGLGVAVMPRGEEAERSTVPVNPPVGWMAIVAVLDEPAAIVRSTGLAARV